MRHYLELQTAKYALASMEEQYVQRKRLRNREAVKALAWGVIGMALISFSILTMPIWIPAAIQFFEARGW